MRPSTLVALALAALSLPLAAAPAPKVKETPKKNVVALVVPFATADDVPDWMGFALSSVIADQFVQSGDGSWVADKQLDSVLRRKDLQLYDAADLEVAHPLAKSLGATDLVLGEIKREGAKLVVSARRVVVGKNEQSREAKVEAGADDLASIGVQLAAKLLDAAPKKAGPLTASARALQEASLCWADLVRHPLQPRIGAVALIENADAVQAHCKAALDADPKLGWARAGLAVLAGMRGKAEEGRSEAVLARKERFVPMSYVAEAYCARRAGDAKGARAALEAGIKAHPGFLLAIGYLGEERMEAEDWQGAMEAWDKVLKRAPAHPFALGQKAHAAARLAQTKTPPDPKLMRAALAYTREALDYDPNDPELLIELASRQIDAKQEAEAERTLRTAMEARPPRPLAWLRLGFLYLKQNKTRDAKDTLTEAVTYAYREDEARVRGLAFADLAVVAAMQNNYTEVVEYLAAARAEGLQDKKLPCDAVEMKAFKGRAEFDGVCAGKSK